MAPTIEAIQADITTLHVDAIVNAANQMLAPGAGVCGAIHKAAGPRLEEACLQLPEVQPGVRCMPGMAVVTRAFQLPCRAVIHTVGPVWVDGRSGEDDVLAKCYRSCLELCRRGRVRSVAFPAIATGRYGFPPQYAAIIAVGTLTSELWPPSGQPDRYPHLERVVLVAYDPQTLALYEDQLARARARREPDPDRSALPASDREDTAPAR